MSTTIETKNLTKTSGDVLTVSDVSPRLNRREIFTFWGPNVAGKMTTIRMLLGMIKPITVEVQVLGSEISIRGKKPWSSVVYVVETPNAYCVSHGYLPPMGFVISAVILTQIIAETGSGEFFPWSIPVFYAGMAGPAFVNLGLASFVIVVVTSNVGNDGIYMWWELADQTVTPNLMIASVIP